MPKMRIHQAQRVLRHRQKHGHVLRDSVMIPPILLAICSTIMLLVVEIKSHLILHHLTSSRMMNEHDVVPSVKTGLRP